MVILDDKKEAERLLDSKEKEKPFWEKLPPIVLIGGAIVLILIFQSMQNTGNGTNYFIWIAVGIAIMFLLSKKMEPDLRPVSPKEAEILAERECERKKRWGQDGWSIMDKIDIGPVIDMMHRQSRGYYYNIAVKRTSSFGRIEYYVAKVMSTGLEREFTTLVRSIGPMTGRKVQQEKDILHIPDWIKRSNRYPSLDKIWGFGKT